MEFQRRRLAAIESLIPSATVALRDSNTATAIMTTIPTPAPPSSTIAPFDTGLTGVNQPNNMLVKDLLWWSLGVVGLVILSIRLLEIGWALLRQVLSRAENQAYWMSAQWHRMPNLKKNVIYAPLWNKRHNREIKLSSAINVGTLPSRLHAFLLGAYFVSNFIYMFYLDWAQADRYSLLAELRGRAGTLAAVNMVPLVIMAGRNNPLIKILKISFDTYNLLHRWMGRTVVVEVLVHFGAWATVQVAADGWASANAKILHDRFIASGSAGALAMVLILLLSLSPVRHAFYETFLNTHIILAFIVFITAWIHCSSSSIVGGLPQLPWIIAVVCIWLFERSTRVIRLAYFNWSGRGYTDAVVEPMPGETCRVTLHLPRYVNVQPGTHAYLRFAHVSPWENHPFSIAWVEHTTEDDGLTRNNKEGAPPPRKVATSVSFVIAAQTGFTRKLYNTARAMGKREVRLRAALEGPYAGHHSLDSYGHVLLIAGATGITHQISYLRHLISGFDHGTAATRRVVLVWIVRDYVALEWVRPWMDTVLRMPRRKDVLEIQLFVTRPKSPREITSKSGSVKIYGGRPKIQLLLRGEVKAQVGAMVVSVCGPGGLADDVRAAVRDVQDEGKVVDFIEESFTW